MNRKTPIRAAAVAALAAAAALAGCQKRIEAPTEAGVCYQVLTDKTGAVKFSKIAENQQSIEYCAARLEEVRMRFLRLGGTRLELTGAYQGRFVFVDQYGASTAEHLDGGRFQMLTRAPDGRLVVPGMIRQDAPAA